MHAQEAACTTLQRHSEACSHRPHLMCTSSSIGKGCLHHNSTQPRGALHSLLRQWRCCHGVAALQRQQPTPALQQHLCAVRQPRLWRCCSRHATSLQETTRQVLQGEEDAGLLRMLQRCTCCLQHSHFVAHAQCCQGPAGVHQLALIPRQRRLQGLLRRHAPRQHQPQHLRNVRHCCRRCWDRRCTCCCCCADLLPREHVSCKAAEGHHQLPCCLRQLAASCWALQHCHQRQQPLCGGSRQQQVGPLGTWLDLRGVWQPFAAPLRVLQHEAGQGAEPEVRSVGQ
jgi:hypothetical protein